MTDVTVAAMEYLEDSIDRRIVALEEINSHYLNLRSKLGKRHEKTAFDVVTTSSMSGVNKPLDTTSKTSTSDSEANDCQDGFSPALSKILNQAREIRNAPKVKAKRDSLAIRAIDGAKSTKTSIKGDFDNGLTNDPANSIPVCSKIPDEDIKYHQKSKLIADLRLCGQHKSCPLSCLGGTSSELFVSESKFLSQVSGRTVLPSSVPFELLNDAPYGVDVNARKMKIDEPIVGAMCAKLLISVKQHRLAYNRTLKSRISRIGFSNFSKDDIAEVIESWYRIRKYNMIYDEIHNVFESSASMDNDADASSDHSQSAESKPHAEFPPTDEQLILRDVDALPLCTPIFIRGRISASRANFSSVGNKRWQQIHLQRVNIFNLTFQTRVKYAVESLIGKHQLKRVVAALKLCCAESMATTDASSKEVHRCQWSFRSKKEELYDEAMDEIQKMEKILTQRTQRLFEDLREIVRQDHADLLAEFEDAENAKEQLNCAKASFDKINASLFKFHVSSVRFIESTSSGKPRDNIRNLSQVPKRTIITPENDGGEIHQLKGARIQDDGI